MSSKKILLIPVLILAVSFLAACGKQSRPTLEDRIGSSQDMISLSYEGTLETIEKLQPHQQGTHQLQTKSEGTIVLQSRSIDLSKYLNKEVLVQGVMEEGIGNAKPVLTVEKISYTNPEESMELKTYTNNAEGFKFSYPSAWLLSDEGDALTLSFQEHQAVHLSVLSGFDDAQKAAALESTDLNKAEVTVAAQKSIRFIMPDETLVFYVPNPPLKNVYRLTYNPEGISLYPESMELMKDGFYELLESFELIFTPTSNSNGEPCGGIQKLECAEGQICQLESDAEFANGTCTSVDQQDKATNCPYIAPPLGCAEYRISEYNLKGCPARYECVQDETLATPVPTRDLNQVEESEVVGDEALDEQDETEASSPDSEAPDEEAELSEGETETVYEIPKADGLTQEYVNTKKNFSLNIPKTWYYASFGPVDGTLWKVGFSNKEFEEADQALVTLSLMKDPGGDASREIDNVYYVFEGPSDLVPIMKEMLGTVEVLGE